MSMPAIRRAVTHHATPAAANSRAMTPSRPRRATPSGSPGELRAREGRLGLVRNAEGVDARARRVRNRQLAARRMEDPRELRRLTALDAERDDVLDLEVDRVADPDRMRQAVLANLDRRALRAEVLADQR